MQSDINSNNDYQDQQVVVEEFKQTSLEKQCEHCKKRQKELFNCSNCKKVYYCNVKCQRKDWKIHKEQCQQNNVEVIEAKKGYQQVKEVFESINDFIDLENIGTGNFTNVVKGRYKLTGKTYAIKVINKVEVNKVNKIEDVQMEKHVLTRLKEVEEVVRIYSTFQDNMNLYMVSEYVENGELWAQCKQFGVQNTNLIKYYLASICKAVANIHQNGIVHRDLKPENIMLDNTGRLKLIDFGTSRDMLNPEIKGSGNGRKDKKVFEHYVGTPNFMSPEQVRNKDSDYKSDVWAIASIATQLVTGFPAFLADSDYLVFQQFVEEEKYYEEHPYLVLPDQTFPPLLNDWVRFLLVRDKQQRPTLQQAMNHPYFQDIDFNHIQSHHHYSQQISPDDLLLIDCQKIVLKQMKMNQEILKSYIQSYIQQVPTNTNIQDVDRTIARLNLLEKQLMHFLKINDHQYRHN